MAARHSRSVAFATALLLGAGIQLAPPLVGFVSLSCLKGRIGAWSPRSRSSAPVRTARSALTFADIQLGEKHSGKVAYIADDQIDVDIGAPSLVVKAEMLDWISLTLVRHCIRTVMCRRTGRAGDGDVVFVFV
mmetsp:Transcript_6413/g.18439  ORF Transcript_6413/g.18439 Transcript_6413/m.18439 type:complete len:133 (+) Transcript_6413:126-524(+)